MSINVTVSGNPVSIRRGKMVTADADHAKKEFENRRRMRLEQVRQQSKDIAEDVRKKVRNEKTKQLSSIEKQGADKLKEWQSRKLLQLQNQYEECLKDIGLAHNNATIVEEEEDTQTAEVTKSNKEAAKERGEKASQKQQVEKNDKNLQKAIPAQKKKLTRDNENTRSQMVTKLNKTKKSPFKKKKRKKAGINISIRSDSDSEVPVLKLSSEDSDSECIANNHDNISEVSCRSPEEISIPKSSTATSLIKTRSPIKSKRFSLEDETRYHHVRTNDFNFDSRISDRIRNRRLIPAKEYLYNVDRVQASSAEEPVIASNPKISSCERVVNFEVPSEFCPCDGPIPYKPTVSLKNVQSRECLPEDGNKVQYYDHSNRFSKQSVSDGKVERIPDESIEVCPSNGGGAEYMQAVYKRDREAQLRGQKALEKAKIARDYEEMMRQLPVLQRQERLASVKTHNPSHHLSEERLKELKQRKQNCMENCCSRIFTLPKPSVITIPPRIPVIDGSIDVPYKSIDVPDSTSNLNVGYWDSAENHDKIVETQELQTESLQTILNRLKLQKEQIIKEIGVLPKNSKLYKLLNELEQFEKSKEIPEEKNEAKETKMSPKNLKITKTKEKRTRDAFSQVSSSAEDRSPVLSSGSSKKTIAKRKDVSVQQSKETIEKTKKSLHDVETQTVGKESNDKAVGQEIEKASLQKIPCDCDVKERKEPEKLCEIVIKIREDEKPEVIVSPSESKEAAVIASDPVVATVAKPLAPSGDDSSKRKKAAVKKKVAVTPNSWGEFFADFTHTSSSTSYYSVPDFNATKTSEHSKAFARILHGKIRQRNLVASSASETTKKELDPRLVVYIKKLLKMSHANVAELTVSTASDVSTPNTSVIETETNVPLTQLQNVMKFFNLSAEDVAQFVTPETKAPTSSLSSSSGSELSYVNTTGYDASRSSRTIQSGYFGPKRKTSKTLQAASIKTQIAGKDVIDNWKSVSISQEETKTSVSNETNDTQYVILERKIENLSQHHSSDPRETSIMQKYSEIAENCHKRISSLTAMIEKVRQEKKEILRSPNTSSSDKENSTAYLNLPSQLIQASDSKSSSSSTISLEQEELNKKLLEIDYTLVENLKLLSPNKIKELHKELQVAKILETSSDESKISEDEMMARFKRLTDDSATKPTILVMTPFVPLLEDIPKLPKLPQQSMEGKNGKKPPIAKGLIAAKRYNENIVAIPHELSTIVEADSLTSTKLPQKLSFRNQNQLQSTVPSPKESVQMIDSNSSESMPDILLDSAKSLPKLSIVEVKSISEEFEDSEKIMTSTEKSKSSSDENNVEAMLQSMGMGWAVATIRKTQEALAQSSSTSSLEDSLRQKPKKPSNKSSGSEISLQQFLSRKLIESVSKGSESNLSEYMRELGEISAIHSSSNTDNKNQRTSTPVQNSKSTEKSKTQEMKFTAESDISSVRSSSDINFVSLPDYTKSNEDD